MGAVTVSIVKHQILGGVTRNVLADVTFSGTYAAGGDTYTASQFGMQTVHAIIPQGYAVATSTTGYGVSPDLANSKIRLIGGAASGVAGAETGTANQASTVARVIVVGDDPYV